MYKLGWRSRAEVVNDGQCGNPFALAAMECTNGRWKTQLNALCTSTLAHDKGGSNT